MANEEKKNITISKNNTGFPAYLDFDQLRSEGIAYLGKLSGQLWTDHNVHDPGITIYEALCYAVLDLGYRTNLPVADILARNPADTSKDNNFFTPAQILTCNPLTINDYRKLLIDIPGVKNAWLEVATDEKDKCRYQVLEETGGDKQEPVTVILAEHDKAVAGNNIPCETFLNGLYHVYIEPQEDLAEGSQEWNDLLELVKKTLMAHRNLCEDFVDIYILCKMDTGICANIELEEDADAENVYVAIATRLREFLSPAPKFYTLPELLEKGKNIEDIFSGRPYSKESHGFVDTEELEQIPLRRELHTSDIYTAIFEVPGVKKISRLTLKNCGKNCEPVAPEKNTYWKFHIPKNHIPSFSLTCSGFEFTRNGMRVAIDTEKFETLLELTFTHTGKLQYKMPSPYLDQKVPNGIYHSGLGDYYSIQNDFPQVYGIAEGSLSDNSTDQRKAWALQLKGYLLFFDQVLANYLAQLKNIRQLFSLTGAATKKEQHTYFLNKLTTVPELGKLLRFGEENDNTLGTMGTVLVFPILKEEWEKVNTKLHLAEDIIAAQQPYSFPSLSALHDAASLLRDDLMNEAEIKVQAYQTGDECWLFTIESSSEEYLLLGKKISGTETEARQHAASVQYTGVFENNYHSFLTVTNEYTFNIELNIVSYTDYMGLLVEDDELYARRRKQFLSHLLSRFSEKFTDFVLLNWKSGHEEEALTGVGRFLSHYDDISRNRGRAYDYRANGWNNENLSGFEKKVKALAGIEGWGKKDLCNFTVDLYDEQYILDFSQTGSFAFTVNEKYDLFDDAVKSASDVIKAMATPANYTYRYLPENKQYQLMLQYGAATPAVYPHTFNNSNDADHLVAYLSNSIAQKPAAGAVHEHSYTWKATLHNAGGDIIKTAADIWHSEEEAVAAIAKLSEKINDNKKWAAAKKGIVSNELFFDKNHETEKRFIDIAAFNIDINDTIIGKPGLFTYDVLDKETNSFKLCPATEFNNAKQAREHCCKVLAAAIDKDNCSIARSKETNQFAISVRLSSGPEAICATQYATKAEAEKALSHITGTIKKYAYDIRLAKTPETWKFSYPLGHDRNNIHSFLSEEKYNSPEAALEAANNFQKNIPGIDIREAQQKITLAIAKNKTVPAVVYAAADGAQPATAGDIKKELEQLQQLVRMTGMNKPEQLKEYVKVDGVGQFGTYVYRLVNKGHIPAFHTEVFDTEALANSRRKAIAAQTKRRLAEVPEICMGGDIFTEIKDKHNVKWYRYQVKLYSIKGAPVKELVLFESVAAFTAKEDAQKAFLKNYLHILRFAMDAREYGKTISKIPVPLKEKDACNPEEVIAYVPELTRLFLEKEIGANWPEGLSEYLKNYPVKIIDADSLEFASLFCRDFKDEPKSCKKDDINWVYYFSLPMQDVATGQRRKLEWRSNRYFETADAAMQEFRYFSRLIGFTGNYYVDCGCTRELDPTTNEWVTNYGYKIFIREVLAQSTNWYQRKEDAWGKAGIEKFICAVQSGNAFQHYLRKEDCCYSFYTVCGTGILEHPCKYDTQNQRDAAIEQLYKYFRELYTTKAYGTQETDKSLVLNDGNGKPFAQAITQTFDPKGFCSLKIVLAALIAERDYTIEARADGMLTINTTGGRIMIESTEKMTIANEEALEKWKKEWHGKLLQWACYYPITRTRIDGAEKRVDAGGIVKVAYKYCIELKLPGFNTCEEDGQIEKPCNACGEKQTATTTNGCYLAWKSVCCYETCEEAVKALDEVVKYLIDKKNYQPVFDCTCNSYGINLHANNQVLYTPERLKELSGKDDNRQTIDIIAINPQCYETADEVCNAVETATKLVNSEGMHLVEHILLRPHCYDECSCRYDLQWCNTGCGFTPYPSNDTDPCTKQPANICFAPGTDPYSFIATIALPAWSQRFRQRNNREILEQLLYREAPAHVLLRILWLTPHDFCRFETTYKNWNKWLAGISNCNKEFTTCDMFEMVFKSFFECPEEACDCKPCKEPGVKEKTNCATEAIANEPQFVFLNQVNDIFCLNRYCKEERPGELDEKIKHEAAIAAMPVKVLPKKTITAAVVETVPETKVEPEAEKQTVKTGTTKEQPIPAKEVSPDETAKKTAITENKEKNIQLKAKVVNARFTRYRNVALNVLEHSKGNPVVAKLQSFLAAATPAADALEKVVTDIIQNTKPTTRAAKILNRKQQLTLLEAAVCHYLDKICFNGKDETRIRALQNITVRMIKAKIDMQSIYNYWDAAEVEKYEPGTDTDFIRHIITGKK
jgi:hypothetical protein